MAKTKIAFFGSGEVRGGHFAASKLDFAGEEIQRLLQENNDRLAKFQPQAIAHTLGQISMHMGKHINKFLPGIFVVALSQLKTKRIHNVLLLKRTHAVPKHRRL